MNGKRLPSTRNRNYCERDIRENILEMKRKNALTGAEILCMITYGYRTGTRVDH